MHSRWLCWGIALGRVEKFLKGRSQALKFEAILPPNSADLERLYYPLGRYVNANYENNEELGELTDPPIITERIAGDAAAGSTQEYDSDLDELLSLDKNPIDEAEDDNIDLN